MLRRWCGTDDERLDGLPLKREVMFLRRGRGNGDDGRYHVVLLCFVCGSAAWLKDIPYSIPTVNNEIVFCVLVSGGV